jgi:hypothetical protein
MKPKKAVGRDVPKEDSMASICPFCWSRNIKRVGPRSGGDAGGTERNLMECEDCEKWFWAGSKEEVSTLFSNCETAILHPGRCYPEVLGVALSGASGFPRRRWAEFNHLCSLCPNGRYVPCPGVFRGQRNAFPVPVRRNGYAQTKGG